MPEQTPVGLEPPQRRRSPKAPGLLTLLGLAADAASMLPPNLRLSSLIFA
jgi:hypothetical protein